MLEDADRLPGTYKSCALWISLFDGLQWLRKSIEILDPNNHCQFELSCVDKHLLLSEVSMIIYRIVCLWIIEYSKSALSMHLTILNCRNYACHFH